MLAFSKKYSKYMKKLPFLALCVVHTALLTFQESSKSDYCKCGLAAGISGWLVVESFAGIRDNEMKTPKEKLEVVGHLCEALCHADDLIWYSRKAPFLKNRGYFRFMGLIFFGPSVSQLKRVHEIRDETCLFDFGCGILHFLKGRGCLLTDPQMDGRKEEQQPDEEGLNNSLR